MTAIANPSSASPPPDRDERIEEVFARQVAHRETVAAASAGERRAKLERLLAWVEGHREEIRRAAWEDFRKPAPEVDLAEIYGVVSEARFAIRHLRRWMKPWPVPRTLGLATARARVVYEPKGVVLVIAPWNYPFLLTVGPLISAVAAGNCVCVKPSELTPAVSALLGHMVGELFPEEEVALFEGEAEVAKALLAKPFDHVFYTGGSAVGRHVMRAASEHLASVTLELGGKSPALVDETADLGDAATKIAWGKFVNCGQTCIAPDYVLVHESRAAALSEALATEIRKAYGETAEARRASPDYARIVNGRHFERLRRLFAETVERGSEIDFGGEHDAADRYFEPTLLSAVDLDSPAMREEIFGPILPVLPYRDLDEALAVVGGLPKPLALYLFTGSARNRRRVLAGARAGGTCVNDVALHFLHPHLPFGGVGESGFGSAHGFFGFKTFSHERAVLEHHRWSALKLMSPPYGRRARKLISWVVKYL